jgi:hypothetical protein
VVRSTNSSHEQISLVKQAKATRGRVRTPKAFAKRDDRLDGFRTKCFWSAVPPRIALIAR